MGLAGDRRTYLTSPNCSFTPLETSAMALASILLRRRELVGLLDCGRGDDKGGRTGTGQMNPSQPRPLATDDKESLETGVESRRVAESEISRHRTL